MIEQHMDQFLRGVIALGFAVAGLFFWKFWTRTSERLFILFSIAFFILSANRMMIAMAHEEVATYLYLIRLAAFLIILYAIWDANRRR